MNVMNVEKTKMMLLAPKRRQDTPSLDSIDINIQGKPVTQVTDERLLGLQIDHNLTWEAQIRKLRQTILFKLSILRKIKRYLPLETRKLFYNFYIKPHFDYCSTIWSQCSLKGRNTIAKLQKQAARLILDEKLDRENTTPSASLFKTLRWKSFQYNLQFRQSQLIFKSVNNLAPPYMRNMFTFVHAKASCNLRSSTSNKLYVQRAHPKSFRFRGPLIWNSLPPIVRNAQSLNQFNRLYLKHVQ